MLRREERARHDRVLPYGLTRMESRVPIMPPPRLTRNRQQIIRDRDAPPMMNSPIRGRVVVYAFCIYLQSAEFDLNSAHCSAVQSAATAAAATNSLSALHFLSAMSAH